MTIIQAFVASLGRLAAPATEQIEYLTSLGVADLVDELALEFDDLYRPIARDLEKASPVTAAACRALDHMLSSDQLGWTFADLELGPGCTVVMLDEHVWCNAAVSFEGVDPIATALSVALETNELLDDEAILVRSALTMMNLWLENEYDPNVSDSDDAE